MLLIDFLSRDMAGLLYFHWMNQYKLLLQTITVR